MDEHVKVTSDTVIIEHVECREPAVVEFFGGVVEERRVETVGHALAVGVAGLRTMNAHADVEQVEKGFEKLQRQFEQAFDPQRKDSYLGQLEGTVEGYFGENGIMVSAIGVTEQLMQKTILEQMASLRDAVIGKLAAVEERQIGTAKGGDFEDEVKAVLCRLAKVYGDTVRDVTHEAGDSGLSKKGDFVIELAEGPRITVEAKNMTSVIGLTGGAGILATLSASKLNRQAAFAIAVSKHADALPKEVGPFNEYGGDKVLCAFGDDGEMLEVAYRWARAKLLTQLGETEHDIDGEAVRASLAEVRESVDELGKVKAKASAIIKNANDIQDIAHVQVARAKAALSQAERALIVDVDVKTDPSPVVGRLAS